MTMAEFPISPDQLLTPEECLEVDRTLLPSADKFAARIAIYAWRYLQQISQETGTAIAALQPTQIIAWVEFDPQLQAKEAGEHGFEQWYIQLLLSAQIRLKEIAQDTGVDLEALTVSQVVRWFEQDVKARRS